MPMKQEFLMSVMHEVACWIVYEREMGSFTPRVYENSQGLPKVWSVDRYLAGACAVASYVLAMVLRSRGIQAGVVSACRAGHFWVETACGWHLDPTYMQFAPAHGPRIRRATRARKRGMGLPRESMLNVAKKKDLDHPCMPNYHTETIERILRRMGVLETSS